MTYEINVYRFSQDTGILTYKHGDIMVYTMCWFDPKVRIPAKRYTGCSATHMARAYKQTASGGIDWSRLEKNTEWQAIFFPDAQTGHKGIFIHKGTNAGASDGCIVISYGELMRIWGSIDPRDGKNVEVYVTG